MDNRGVVGRGSMNNRGSVNNGGSMNNRGGVVDRGGNSMSDGGATAWPRPCPTTAPCPRWAATPPTAVLLTVSLEATESMGEPKALAWLVDRTSPWKGLETDWWERCRGDGGAEGLGLAGGPHLTLEGLGDGL